MAKVRGRANNNYERWAREQAEHHQQSQRWRQGPGRDLECKVLCEQNPSAPYHIHLTYHTITSVENRRCTSLSRRSVCVSGCRASFSRSKASSGRTISFPLPSTAPKLPSSRTSYTRSFSYLFHPLLLDIPRLKQTRRKTSTHPHPPDTAFSPNKPPFG